MILALDPGTTQTAYVLWDGHRVVAHGVHVNAEILEFLHGDTRLCEGFSFDDDDELAVEMIASYGMAVGATVFETCVWIGRFVEAWSPRPFKFVYRREVKSDLCGSQKAKDGNIRQALIDRIGPQGTKKAPGPTYGIHGDEWAALGVAVVASKTANGIGRDNGVTVEPEHD